MQDISREAILRMVGLHDAAQFMRQINAIQLSLEEQNGQMVAYWTEIRKDERQITLVAGRVSANETSIGQLQVTATSLTASVTSLNTTVNGDGTQGSGLVSQVSSLSLTVGNINLSVQSLSTTVNGDGTQGSGLVSRVSSLELSDTSIKQRVKVIEDDYVTEGEISLMVKKDGNGYISNASIKADNIDFTFTRSTNFISGGQTVMNINSSGDLWILGEYKGGSITGDITVGTGTNKMYIKPNTNGGASLIGMRGGTEVINLGFESRGGTTSYGVLSLGVYGDTLAEIHSHFLMVSNGGEKTGTKAELRHSELWFGNVGSAVGKAYFGLRSGKIFINADSWPSLSDVIVGSVYLDNGYLKVRTS